MNLLWKLSRCQADGRGREVGICFKRASARTTSFNEDRSPLTQSKLLTTSALIKETMILQKRFILSKYEPVDIAIKIAVIQLRHGSRLPVCE